MLPAGLVLFTGLLVLLLRWLGRTPAGWLWAFLSAALLMALALLLSRPLPTGLLAAGLALSLSLLGGGGSAFRSGAGRARTRAGVASALGAASLLGVAGLLLWDGRAGPAVPNAAATASALVPRLALPDPSARGSFPVATLTYGSGDDRHRPEFGAKVILRTAPFDGSRLIGRWKGRSGWARTRFFGFDGKRLPIQARVYYPEGPGPFPLVLAVHGNHSMEEWSDPGYGYLGELLASRGILFASVDENFLNLPPIPTTGG